MLIAAYTMSDFAIGGSGRSGVTQDCDSKNLLGTNVKTKITKILGFGGSCPTQLDAITDDNRMVYGRYRWGKLSICLGEPGELNDMAAVCGKEIFRTEVGGEYDGCMDLSEMAELTEEVIEWPENLSVDNNEQIGYILP